MTSSEKVRIIKRKFDKNQHTLSDILDFLDSLELRPIILDKDTIIDCAMNFPKLKFNRSQVEVLASQVSIHEQPHAVTLTTTLADAGIEGDSVVWVSVSDD